MKRVRLNVDPKKRHVVMVFENKDYSYGGYDPSNAMINWLYHSKVVMEVRKEYVNDMGASLCSLVLVDESGHERYIRTLSNYLVAVDGGVSDHFGGRVELF